jgi:DNA invertase Pin-like site-specific DNA recombinase
MSTPLRAATYSRVSTSDKGQNPEVQAAELRRYTAARGWTLAEEIIDHGFSGGTDQRPGLKRLMALIRAREVDVIVVTKLDRFARSLKHLVSALDEFTALGVLFVSVGDQIDLTTASGRLMLHLLAAFAEFERALIRERTLMGLAHAKSCGKVLGRPKTRDDDAILRLRAEGLSYSQIQKRLGISRPAIHRALKSAGTKSPKNLSEKFQSFQEGRHGQNR